MNIIKKIKQIFCTHEYEIVQTEEIPEGDIAIAVTLKCHKCDDEFMFVVER